MTASNAAAGGERPPAFEPQAAITGGFQPHFSLLPGSYTAA
jgi:hypothetical protein